MHNLGLGMPLALGVRQEPITPTWKNPMLVLTRSVGEKITIDEDVTITVVEVRGNRIRLGIEAPQHVRIRRTELVDALERRELQSMRQRLQTVG